MSHHQSSPVITKSSLRFVRLGVVSKHEELNNHHNHHLDRDRDIGIEAVGNMVEGLSLPGTVMIVMIVMTAQVRACFLVKSGQ